jgi:hypothetical protein
MHVCVVHRRVHCQPAEQRGTPLQHAGDTD